MRPLVALLRPFMRSPERGADTSVYLASSPEAAASPACTSPAGRPRSPATSSYDTAITARLWQVSADLVGLRTPA